MLVVASHRQVDLRANLHNDCLLIETTPQHDLFETTLPNFDSLLAPCWPQGL